MPQVSLCMIVKNEEASLKRCLASAADLVGEIIIIDTGSTDRTKEVARSFNAQVFDYAWSDSFAAARNESLCHATSPWIFWLDGDEWLDQENRERLRVLFGGLNEEIAGYLMKQQSSVGGAEKLVDQARLFPRHPDVIWEYRVHEQILPSIKRRLGGKAEWSDVIIQHAGYEDAATRQRKHERNLRLLQLEIAERPDDPFVLFNLAWALQELGRVGEAVPFFRRSLDRFKPGDLLTRKVYALLTESLRRLGQKQEALMNCRAGRKLFPQDAELLYQEAVLLKELGDLAGAERSWLQLLRETPKEEYLAIGVDGGLRGYLTRFQLGLLYRAQKRFAEAEQVWKAVVAERPDHTATWLELTDLYLAQQRPEAIEKIIQHLEGERPVEAALVKARLLAFKNDFAAARQLLEGIIVQGPQALVPRLVLSHVLLQEGTDWTAAEQALRDVLALDPTHASSRRNLEVLLKRRQGKTLEKS